MTVRNEVSRETGSWRGGAGAGAGEEEDDDGVSNAQSETKIDGGKCRAGPKPWWTRPRVRRFHRTGPLFLCFGSSGLG